MALVIKLVVLLHIAAAAILFGYPLGLVGSVRRALDAGDEPYRLAAAEAARKGGITGMFAVITLLTGIGLIFLRGGFGAVVPGIHISMLLLMLAIVFNLAWMKPNTARLVAAAEGDTVDRPMAEAALKKLGMGSGMLHAVWFSILFLMLFRY